MKEYNDRVALAEAHLPREFSDVTMCVDGTDCRVWCRRSQGQVASTFYSHKFKKPALRTQVKYNHVIIRS